ncbi:MAG: RNA polymerase sigma factor [Ruminococcus sp.]|nr:RNA polymerase sigma factor [Ruminococcus sp.]
MDIKNLIFEARKGSSEAFGKLYSLYYKEMYYYALSRLRSEDDACDAVSEAVLDAFASIKKLKNEDLFKSWLFTILTRKITKKYSEYQKQTESIDDVSGEIDKNGELPDITKIESDEILDTLSEKERQMFSLCYVCGFTSEEISKMTNTNPSTVRSHLLRAKNKLRILYSDKTV